jgi:hypothetical protein
MNYEPLVHKNIYMYIQKTIQSYEWASITVCTN